MEEMTQGQTPVQPTDAETAAPVAEVPETPASTTEAPVAEAPVAPAAETSEQAPAA